MNAENEKVLQGFRHVVRDKKKVATCLGFGPRFLHSTGQAYKGGPNSGVFLQITCDDASDLPVPGQKYTFGVGESGAGARRLQCLSERGRRALRVSSRQESEVRAKGAFESRAASRFLKSRGSSLEQFAAEEQTECNSE